MKNRNTSIAFGTNFICAIFEFIIGTFTNSIAIISDSIHDLLDAFIVLILYITGKKANKKADSQYTYGYKRYALLGTLISSFMLFIGGIFAINRAIPRLFNPQIVKVDYIIIFGVIGIIVNIVSLSKMQKEKSHKHISAYFIVMEDLITWFLVYTVSIIIKKTNMYILDSVLSIIIATYILMHGFEYLIKSIKIFMDIAPSNINIESLKNNILNIEKIKKIAKLHLWSIDEETNCIVLHIVIDKNCNNEEYIKIKENIKEIVYKYYIQEISIDIDYEKEDVEGRMYEER